jgi:SAM-dependent methyltransferase
MSSSSLLRGYDVVVCDKCGFCFADNIPEIEVFNKYYRDMSKYEKTEKGGQDSPFDQARFQNMAEVILKFITKRDVRIFEVGCANGQLLSLLKKKGYENIAGIDPSPVSAEIARLRYGINVTANTLSDFEIEDGTIDFLILVGVMEHLPKLSVALQKFKNMLSLGGLLFISVPDAARYPEGEDGPFQEFSLEHINFFGQGSLKNLLEVNGFEQLSSEKGMIESNYRTTTPVIHSIFKKVKTSKPKKIVRDTKTEKGLRTYIDKSTKEDRHIQNAIKNVIKPGNPIIVWGTGAHTLRLLSTSQLGKAKIRAFVDSNPRYQGKRLNDIPIISPNSLNEYPEPILISSRCYQEEIAAQIIDDLRLNNKVIKLYKMD